VYIWFVRRWLKRRPSTILASEITERVRSFGPRYVD